MVCDFVICQLLYLQGGFYDTEADLSVRLPVGRQYSSDVKHARHTSQWSIKVRAARDSGVFEKATVHNLSDPSICLLSLISVSTTTVLLQYYYSTTTQSSLHSVRPKTSLHPVSTTVTPSSLVFLINLCVSSNWSKIQPPVSLPELLP